MCRKHACVIKTLSANTVRLRVTWHNIRSISTLHQKALVYCMKLLQTDYQNIPYDWIISNKAFRHAFDYLIAWLLQTWKRSENYFRSFYALVEKRLKESRVSCCVVWLIIDTNRYISMWFITVGSTLNRNWCVGRLMPTFWRKPKWNLVSRFPKNVKRG